MSVYDKPSKNTTVTWITPKYITDSLGKFDLDPCVPNGGGPWKHAKDYIEENSDGLCFSRWWGRVWLNPPYGRKKIMEPWLERMVKHNNGILLVSARTDTKWFHDYVFGCAKAILFLKNRISFCNINGFQIKGNSAPSILASYGNNNIESLRNCGLEGQFFTINENL